MNAVSKWTLGALAFLGLSLGLAAPAQAYGGYYGHPGGGLTVSFGDPYHGVHLSVPIGHRYHHRRHYGRHPYYYRGHDYHPYAYHYPPRYRHRYHWRHHPHRWAHHPRWRDHGWRHHRKHWRRHHHRWH